MQDDPGFLEAILEDPDNDDLRLIYADWLEDHGQSARGRFIRAHVEWCRRDSNIPPTEEKQRELISSWRSSGLADFHIPGEVAHVFDRGMIAGVRIQNQSVNPDLIRGLLETSPIQVVSLEPDEPFTSAGDVDLGCLENTGLLERLIGLGISEWLEGTRYALTSPSSKNLEFFHFDNWWAGSRSELAQMLGETEHLGSVQVLDLNRSQLENGGLIGLSVSRSLKEVRKLEMRSNHRTSHHIGETGFRAMTTSDSIQQLTHLNFRDCTIDRAALDWLIYWPRAGQLLELDLAFSDLTGDDILAMTRSGSFSSLRRLALSAFEIHDDAVRALASRQGLPALVELHLDADHEYGEWDNQSPEALEWLIDGLGDRLTLADSKGPSFELSPIGRADRIWQRLHRIGDTDEFGHDVGRIL